MVQHSLYSLRDRLQLHRTAPNEISLHQGCVMLNDCAAHCQTVQEKGFAPRSITSNCTCTRNCFCVFALCLYKVFRLSEIRLKLWTLYSWPGWRVRRIHCRWVGRKRVLGFVCVCVWDWKRKGRNRESNGKRLNTILSLPHASSPSLCDSLTPSLIVRFLGPSLTFNKSL